ncbi:type II secretion system protein [Candidatus Gracilibacteria bacterium]|nr:type II secretion system protein [Candidatus Gracilibacteria bacterium]
MKFNKSLKSSKCSGETILEVLVAIVILGSVLTATFSILDRALKTNVNIKSRVIALNIAREGLEGVRNIRDTNWLKYSGNRREKWLCLDSIDNLPSSLDVCDGASTVTIEDGYYTVDFLDTYKRYFLVEEGPSDPSGKMDLSTTQTDQAELKLYQTPEKRYTHAEEDGTGTDYDATSFSRQIHIEIQNPYEDESSLPSFCDNDTDEPDCTTHRVKVTSFVQWKDGAVVSSVTLETFLYDFYERDDY